MTEQPEMTERERDQIDAAYYKRFNSYPPIWWWRGSRADLVALMVEAVERDQPLTANDLCDAQGIARPMPGVVY